MFTTLYTVVSRKYTSPFATLAFVQNTGGGGLYAGHDNFSRDYALPSGYEVIVCGEWRWVGAKHGVSSSARRRDAPDTSGRLMNFSVKEQESRALPRVSWHVNH